MHGSVLFLTLATVALGATVRMSSEGTMASAISARNVMNSPSLAARDDVATVTTGGRKSIVVTLDGTKPLVSSDGSPVVDIGNGGGILGSNALNQKKKNGSFLGLRRRAETSLVNVALNLGGQARDSDTLQVLTTSTDDALNLGPKSDSDLSGVAQVDLSGEDTAVDVNLGRFLGTTAERTPCAEGLAAETANTDNVLNANVNVGQAGVADVTDVTGNNAAGNTIAATVDIEEQPMVANGALVDVNTQQPAAIAESGNGVVAQQPAVATDNIDAPAVDVNANQPTADGNIVDVAANTNGPLATTPDGSLVEVTANTNDANVVAVDVPGAAAEPVQKRENNILSDTLTVSKNDVEANLLEIDMARELQGIIASTVNDNEADVLDIDLGSESQGVNVLGGQILGSDRLRRRNRDDDDEDEDEDEDEEEEEVKGSTVKDNKPKDNHPAAEANNEKKEEPKEEPEKHKNAASSGSSSNKMALLGAFVGAVFLLA
ncbi:hypothetical protein BGZ70_009414 [Mortierella alpina]|uniref:Uncharacterized protein n=1 Tax=Mortierella alpina TaxID=64518 RepID=A0A9P6J1Z7_MORAP|nr:hypothetical protein BGZ70_009414 [Mortierella alpina]